MTCKNSSCSIWITCQKKDHPCPAGIYAGILGTRIPVVQNGYKAMARQEHLMRLSSIEFSGDFG